MLQLSRSQSAFLATVSRFPMTHSRHIILPITLTSLHPISSDLTLFKTSKWRLSAVEKSAWGCCNVFSTSASNDNFHSVLHFHFRHLSSPCLDLGALSTTRWQSAGFATSLNFRSDLFGVSMLYTCHITLVRLT